MISATKQTTDSLSIFDTIAQHKMAYTADQLAILLSMSPKTLFSYAKRGKIPSFKIGSLVRFDPKATADWLRTKSIVA